MQHSQVPNRALRPLMLAVVSWASVALAPPAPAGAQAVVALGPFKSVTLRGGGEVVLRHAPAQRVTLLEGSTSVSAVRLVDGDRLVIDRCQGDCPRGYRLSVEILTPEIVDIAVKEGGTIQTRGSFPRQDELGVAVGDGGTADLRSMAVDFVAASILQGGRIFTRPQTAMVANIAHGGAITYWGSPRVKSSVEDGGVVARGAAADADKPLHELNPAPTVVPPVPPVPRTRSHGTW